MDGEIRLVLQPDLHGVGVGARAVARPAQSLPLVLQVERLRRVEAEADGVEVGDVGQDRLVGGDQVAGRHAAVGDQPRLGRGDVGEAEVQRGGGDVGLGRHLVGRRGLFGHQPGLVLLLGDGLGGQQPLGPGQFDPGVGQGRGRVRLLAPGLVERRLVGPGVDDEQGLALVDHLPVHEADGLEVAGYAGAHVHRVDRLEAAHEVVPVDDPLLQGLGDDHGRRRGRCGLLGGATHETQTDANRERDDPHSPSPPAQAPD